MTTTSGAGDLRAGDPKRLVFVTTDGPWDGYIAGLVNGEGEIRWIGYRRRKQANRNHLRTWCRSCRAASHIQRTNKPPGP